MQIPEYITINDAAGDLVAFLSPEDGLKECFPDCRANGESTLGFMLPADSEKLSDIFPECRIVAGPFGKEREYTILKEDAIDTEMDESGKLWAKVMAVESWYLLDKKFPIPYINNDPNITDPADLTVTIVGGGNDLSDGIYTIGSAAHALYALLEGTGWTLGIVDVPGIHDLETEKIDILANIKKVQEIWGGYLLWDSISKTVSLRDETIWQPYTGFQIRYAKNLKHITRTQSNRLITRLYPFGKDDLDIAAVNGGIKFLNNNSFSSTVYIDIKQYPDIDDAQELKDRSALDLADICRPKYLYRANITDMRTLPEYSHEDFSVGEMADVIQSRLGINERQRIIRHKYNLFKPWICDLEIGNPEKRLAEQLKASFNSSNYINDTFNSKGEFPGTKLTNESVDTAKLVDLSITSLKLADAAITTRAIAFSAIDNTRLANLSIDASKLINSSVTASKIALAAIGSAAIAEAAIGSVHIGSGAILTAHIGNAQIVDAHIASLSANKIASGILSGIVIYGGIYSQGHYPFSVDAAGNLFAESANITGVVNATSGNFSGAISIGSGNNIFKANSNGIYLGNSTFAAAPFRVNMAGDVEVSNITITGGSISGVDLYVEFDATVGNLLNIGVDVGAERRINFMNDNYICSILNSLELHSANILSLTATNGVIINDSTGKLGLFGKDPVVMQSISKLSGSPTLTDVVNKVNSLIDKFGDAVGYGALHIV